MTAEQSTTPDPDLHGAEEWSPPGFVPAQAFVLVEEALASARAELARLRPVVDAAREAGESWDNGEWGTGPRGTEAMSKIVAAVAVAGLDGPATPTPVDDPLPLAGPDCPATAGDRCLTTDHPNHLPPTAASVLLRELEQAREVARAIATQAAEPGYERIAEALVEVFEAADLEVKVWRSGAAIGGADAEGVLARTLDKAGLIDWAAFGDAPEPTISEVQQVLRRAGMRLEATVEPDLLAGYSGDDTDPELSQDMAAAMAAEVPADEEANPIAEKCPHCPHSIGDHGYGGCLVTPCRCITKRANLDRWAARRARRQRRGQR